MVNIENIEKIIGLIEKEENYFDMGHWDRSVEYVERKGFTVPPELVNHCGTPSCIGGWAEAVMRVETGVDVSSNVSSSAVGLWLGLSIDETNDLFFPSTATDGIHATRDQALAHLRHIRDGGTVDWKKFAPISDSAVQSLASLRHVAAGDSVVQVSDGV